MIYKFLEARDKVAARECETNPMLLCLRRFMNHRKHGHLNMFHNGTRICPPYSLIADSYWKN